VWAPAIRHHNNLFYIYWGDPDHGIYTVTSQDAITWTKPLLVKEGKGLIDAAPFWDDDGKAYLVYALAGSRATIKSVLMMADMAPDGLSLLSRSRVIFDGHAEHPTIEGPKMYKRDGLYYILAPAGGVKPGWQVAMRSQNPYGPYEIKIVMEQGNTTINGPHQGCYVEADNGEGWFLHFQDKDAYGRIVHLNPVVWRDGWPVMGATPNNRALTGNPVLTHRMPQTKHVSRGQLPLQQTSDNFESPTLGLQWQWHANPMEWWHFCDMENKQLKLFSVPNVADYKNLWQSPNLLMQKFPAEGFEMTGKISLKELMENDVAGFVVFGQDYSGITFQKFGNGFTMNKISVINAHTGTPETIEATRNITHTELLVRVVVNPKRNNSLTSKTDAECVFSYSLDGGRTFTTFGRPFIAKAGRWIGAKVGFYNNRTVRNNDGGSLNIENFDVKITK
ncbi:MAG: family 43 glycosylhydrolase, partial [Bacteroidales bacterium]|nr:family 43 glycosylhydrolase [Bacteroidales bacterium]